MNEFYFRYRNHSKCNGKSLGNININIWDANYSFKNIKTQLHFAL